MKQRIRNYLPIAIAAAVLLLLAACVRPMVDTTESDKIIGKAMYQGVLYDVTDVTTGCCFEDDLEFEDAIVLPENQTPTKDLECTVSGAQTQFAEVGDTILLVVDGTQYVLNP